LASVKELEGKSNSMLKSDLYNQIGVLHYDRQNYVPALEYLMEAFRISTVINDKYSIALINNNLGLIFMETKDYASARTYFKTCISMAGNNHYLKSLSLINIGLADYYEEEYTSALGYLEESEKETRSSAQLLYLPSIFLNKGLCYYELGNISKSKTFFEKALVEFKLNKNLDLEYLCKVNLYNIAFLERDYERANLYKIDFIEFEDSIQDVSIKIDFYSYAAKNSLLEGDSILALKFNLKLVEYGKLVLGRLENQALIGLKSEASYLKVSSDLSLLALDHVLVQKEKVVVEEINNQLEKSNRLIIALAVLSLFLTSVFILYLVLSNRKKKQKNLLLEEQRAELSDKNMQILNSFEYANGMEKLLLQQMNPHFLFNALTTVEASIAVGDVDFAKDYIAMFAALLRKTLNHSRLDVISLPEEIDFLESYIKLNSIKQGANFSCQFIYDEDHVEDFVRTPPMLVQPFVENALVHGLYHKIDGEKRLIVEVCPKDNYILWVITDNGVGREKSREIGKTHQGISHGIKITKDRIKWMKNIYGNNFSVEYIDLEEGTKVVLKTPIVEG
jgi:sensor histidine kinase YesM